MIGSALVETLMAGGSRVLRLVRRQPRAGGDEARWDPAVGEVDAAALEGLDAVVHLAGESIAAGRWTAERKDQILRSRTESTSLLSGALARLTRPPATLISASAIGFYGNRGDEVLTEESPPGVGFLAEVCREWEAAAEPARQAGIRVVNLRIGVVLSARGGALKQMLPAFKTGAGGRIGDGRQYISWIALSDLVAAVRFLLTTPQASGPVNAVAPHPVTNAEFTKALGRALGRPTLLPLPAFAVRLAFGEMGEALLLGGARVLPARLQAAGFRFRHAELEGALHAALAEGAQAPPAPTA